jgi:hypothetical protein
MHICCKTDSVNYHTIEFRSEDTLSTWMEIVPNINLHDLTLLIEIAYCGMSSCPLNAGHRFSLTSRPTDRVIASHVITPE